MKTDILELENIANSLTAVAALVGSLSIAQDYNEDIFSQTISFLGDELFKQAEKIEAVLNEEVEKLKAS